MALGRGRPLGSAMVTVANLCSMQYDTGSAVVLLGVKLRTNMEQVCESHT